MAPVLGIDLGTTNSVVCIAEQGELRVLPDASGNVLLPSVVSFHPAGDILVGTGARERRLIDAHNTVYSVKRLIGRPFHSPEVRRAQERFPFELCEAPNGGVMVRSRRETYTLPEISAFVLREIRSLAEQALGESVSQAVVTVPANFNELQRSATKAAGRVAGLDVLRILNEPTAAALAYGYGRGSRERIAVFDLGGGTFDITLLELAGDVFEVLATAGDTFLGGDDIDILIAEKMSEAFLAHHRYDPRTDPQAYERLRAAAEWAKCQLSEQEEVQLRVEELAYGDAGASLDLTFGLTRTALEGLASPLLGRAFDVCEDAMRVAGIRPTQLDNVVLVGGSTRIPLVRRMVTEYFGREPLATIDPDLVVACGAAIQAEALAPTGAKPLARVALRRSTKENLGARVRRQAELNEETLAALKPGPAFQPDRPPILEEPTRVAEAVLAAQLMAELDAPKTQAALLPEEPATKIGPSPTADAWSDLERKVASVPPPIPGLTDLDGESTRAAGQTYESMRASSVPPIPASPRVPQDTPDYAGDSPRPPSQPPPLPRRARALADRKGARTLGFGSGGAGFAVPPEVAAATITADSVPAPPIAPPTPPPIPSSPPPVPTPAPPVPAAEPPFPPSSPPTPPSAAPAARPEPPPTATMRMDASQLPGLPAAQGAAAAGVAVVGAARAPAQPPLLLDVTPLTLGVETAGGFCESVIERNAAIPVEQTRIFSTAADGQQSVSVRIYQGESRRFAENQELGRIELHGLRDGVRGAVKIEVTFVMDADGTLGVRARDEMTGQEQAVRVSLVGGMDEAEVERMAARQAARMGG